MKKYIITLGTFGIVASPMITVVSCGKQPKKHKINATDQTNNKGLEVKVNKFIKEYFTSKKDEVKDSINTARKKSNTQVELIESIIKQLSEKTYSSWVLTSSAQENKDSEIVKQTIESVLRSKLKISKDSPKKYFHHENLYKLSFGKTEIFKGKLKKLDANLDFYKNINSLLPTAIKTIESVDGNTTLKEFFVKNSSLIEILKERLTKRGIAPGEVEQLLKNIYSLDFKISDIKKIHLALNKIIHNVDFDLSKLKNSENVLEQVIALTKDKNVILDSKELNEGMQGLISAMADLTLRNKEKIPEIISMINMFKPGTISTKFASVILSVSKTNIFNEFFNALKNITIEQVQVLEDNILSITKSTDWINFDIFKFITNEKNQEIINNILKTLSLGQKTDEIKNVQEIALTLKKIAKKLKLDLSVLIQNKGEGIFNKLISLISSDEFKKLDKQKLSEDVSHLVKNLISLISSESDNIDNIIELINSLKPNLISSNMKKIITIIVKSDVMKDLAQVKEETLNKILHLDFSVDDILGLLKKWLKLPKDASFIDVFKGLSGTLKQIGVLSDKQIETMNKLMGSDFVTKALSKPGVIKKLKEIFEYNFKKINLNFLVKIIKDFKETKDFKATLTNVLKDLVNDKSNLESIKLIATESINYLLTINNKQFTNINDLLKLVNEMGLISADMAKKIEATLNDASFKEFVINNPDLIKAVKAMLLNPLKHPRAKALVQKIVKDLIKQDRKALIKDAKQYFVNNPKLGANMQAIFKSFVTKVLVLDNGKLTNVNLLLETYIKAKPNSELAKKLGIILNSKFVKDILNQPKVIAKVKEMILQNADKLTLASVKKIIDLMKNGKSNEVTQFIIKTILDDENNIDNLKLIIKESVNYLLTIDNEELVNINSLLILAEEMGLVSDKQLAKINKAKKSPIFKLFITNNKELIKVFKDLLLNPLKSPEINALLKKMIQDLIKQDRKALIDDAIKYFVDANAKDGLLDNDLQKVFKSFVAKVLLTDGQGNLTNVKLLLNTLGKMNPTSETLKKLQVILNSKFAKVIFSQPKVIAKIKEILNYNIEKLNLEGIKKIIELVKGKKYDQITEIIFKTALEDETNFANIKLIFKESVNYLFTLDSKGKYGHLNSLLNIAKELKLITPNMVPQIMDILNGKVFKTFVIDNPEIVNVFKQLIFSPLDKPETKVLIKKMIQDLIKQDRKALIDDAIKYFVDANAKDGVLDSDLQKVFKSFVAKVLLTDGHGNLTNVKLLLNTLEKMDPTSEVLKKLQVILNSKFAKDIFSQPKVIAKIQEILNYNIEKLNLEGVKKILELVKGKKYDQITEIILKTALGDETNFANIKLIFKESINYLFTLDSKGKYVHLNSLLNIAKELKLITPAMVPQIMDILNGKVFKAFVIDNPEIINVFKQLIFSPLDKPETKVLIKKMIQDLIKQDRKALIDDAMQYFVDANAKDGLLDSDLQKVFKSFVAKVLLTDGHGNLTNVKLLLNTLKKMNPTSEVLKKLQVILNSKFAKDIFSQPKVIAKIQEILNYNIEKLNLEGVKKIIELVKGKKYDQITEVLLKAALEDKTNFANIKLIFKESINYLFTLDSKGKYVHLNSLLNIAKELKLITPAMVPQIMDILNGKVFKAFVIDNPEIINVFKQLIFSPLDKPETKVLIKKMIQDLIKQDRKALIDDAMQYFVDANAKDGVLDSNLQEIFKSFVAKVLLTDGQGNLTNVKLLLNTLEKMDPTSEVLKKLQVILNSKFAKDIFSQPKVIAKIKEILNYNIEKLNLEGIKKIIELVKGKKYDQITEIIFKVALGDKTNFANIKLIFKESINYLFTLDSKGKYVHLNSLLNIAKELKLITPAMVPQIMDILNGKVFKAFVIDNPEIINVFKQLIFSPLDKPETKVLIKKMIQDLIKQDRKALIDDAMQYFVDANAKDGLLDSDLQKVFKSFVAKVLLTDGHGNLTNVKLLLNTLEKMNPTSEVLKKLQVILNSKFAKVIFSQPKVIAKIKEILNYNIEKLNLEGIKKIIELVKGKKYDQITEIIFKAALEDETNLANIQLIIKESINYLLTINKNKFTNINQLLKSLRESGFMSEQLVNKIIKVLDSPLIISLIKNEKPFVKAVINLINDNFANLSEEQILNIFKALKNKDYSLLAKNLLQGNIFSNEKSAKDLQLILEKITKFILAKNKDGKIGDHISLLLNEMKKYNLFSDKIDKIQKILNTDIMKGILSDKVINESIQKLIDINIKKLSPKKLKEIFEAFSQGKLKETLKQIITKDVLGDEDSIKELTVVFQGVLTFVLKRNDKLEFANLNKLLNTFKNMGMYTKQITVFQNIFKSEIFVELSKNEGFLTAITELIKFNITNINSETTKKILQLMMQKNYAGILNVLIESNLSNPKAAGHLKTIINTVIDYTLTLNKDGKLGNLSKILKLIGANSRFGKLLTIVTDNLDKNKFFKEFLISKQEILNKLKVHLKNIANNLLNKDTFKKVMNILKSDNKISAKLKELWTSTKVFGKETKGFIVDVINQALTHISNILGNKNLSWNDIQDFINKIDAKDELKKEMIQLVSLFLNENTPSTSIQSIITKLKNIVSHINPDKLLLIFDVMGNSKLSMKGKALQILQIPGLISNENNAQEDLKALVKEVTINALTNMLNGGNLNNYKNALQLFGIKLNESKWTATSNLLKLFLTNAKGEFEYEKVRGLVSEIIDNTNLSITNIQKIANYFTSEKFSASLKGATGMKGKLKLFMNIIKQPEILSVMKNPEKFLGSINKFGYYIFMNFLARTLTNEGIKTIAKITVQFGLFTTEKKATTVLTGLRPFLKDIHKQMVEGTTLGKIVATWLWGKSPQGKPYRWLIPATFDKINDDKNAHITYMQATYFFEMMFKHDVESGWFSNSLKSRAEPSNIKDFINTIVNLTGGQAFWTNFYDTDGSADRDGKKIGKKAKGIADDKKTTLDTIIAIFWKASAINQINDNKIFSKSILIDTFITGIQASIGISAKIKNQIKKLLVDLELATDTSNEALKGLSESKFDNKLQSEIKNFLTNLFNIKLGGKENKLVDRSTLVTLYKSALFHKLMKIMGL